MTYYGQLTSMGTRLDIVLPAIGSNRGDMLLSKIAYELEQWEQALSTHRPDSSAMLLNRRLAETHSAEVNDPLLWQATQLADQGYQLTQGWFNIACGRLYRAYKQDANTNPESVNAYADVRLRLDHQQHRISVDSHHALLDFGGLGKGLALDTTKRLLLEQHVNCGFVSFGESSIIALGQHPNGSYWPIAIDHPIREYQRLQTVPLRDRALTVSSSVANGANAGNLQAHLVNPKNGRLIDELRTVVTVSESAAMGEMISTAKLVAGKRWATRALSADHVDSCRLYIHNMSPSDHSV